MEVRVLGPLEIWHDGEPARLAGAKQRQLLCLLAMRPNMPIAPERLESELWDERPPRTSANALRVHVAAIRKALDPGYASGRSARVPLEPNGYSLHLAAEELDTTRFDSLLTTGLEASKRGNVNEADGALARAIACWRGPALLDAADLQAARPEIARLEQLRVQAIEELANIRLTMGDYVSTISLLEEALVNDPLHEGLISCLMRALYRAGRPSDALRTFARLNSVLATDGLAPSPELRQLEEDILLEREPTTEASGAMRPSRARPSINLSGVVGRRDELLALASIERAAGNGQRVALIDGDAGIGKSTLLQEYAASALARGATVLQASAAQEDDALQPMRMLVEGALAVTGQGAVRHQFLELLDAPAAAGIASKNALEPETLAEERLRFEDNFATALATLDGKPLVLILDDAHWADLSTLRALKHVVRTLDRVLLVVAFRSNEIAGALADRLATLAPPHSTEHVSLKGLDEHELRALLRRRTSLGSNSSLLKATATIRDVTGGNPFFIEELVRELIASGATDDDALRRQLTSLAPTGVRQLIDMRLSRLQPTAALVAHAAAVANQEVTTATLSALCNTPKDDVEEAVEELLDARLMVEDAAVIGSFAFPHALVRNAVYAGMDAAVTQRMHLSCADVLRESATPKPIQIAQHLFQAATLVPAEIRVEAATRAGDEAMRHLAFAEAADWYASALDVHDEASPGATATIQLSLGRALDADGRFAQARDAYLRAAQTALIAADATLLADAATAAFGPWAAGGTTNDDGRALLEQAIEKLGHGDAGRRVRLLACLAMSYYYVDAERQEQLVEEAMALAEELGSEAATASASMAQHLYLTHEPTAALQRIRVAKRAAVAAKRSGLRDAELRLTRAYLGDLLALGDRDRFDRDLDQYERSAQEARSARHIYSATMLRSTQATLNGDLEEAEQFARAASLRGAELGDEARGAELLQTFVLRFQQGRLADIANPAAQRGDQHQPAARAGSTLAALACAQTGQIEKALAIARWAMGSDGRGIPRDVFWLGAHALLASVAATANDQDLAGILYALLEPCADTFVVFGAGAAVLGLGHHWLGVLAAVLGRRDEAIDHLSIAKEQAERIRGPYWAADASQRLAALLEQRQSPGDITSATELRDHARQIAVARSFGRLLATD
jgi:DNA-binding SARP family transcriptional activator